MCVVAAVVVVVNGAPLRAAVDDAARGESPGDATSDIELAFRAWGHIVHLINVAHAVPPPFFLFFIPFLFLVRPPSSPPPPAQMSAESRRRALFLPPGLVELLSRDYS